MTRTSARLGALPGALLAAGLVLTGCATDEAASGHGSGHGSSAAEDGSIDGSSAEFADADVAFAHGMIPHHEQAVEMAQLAEGRAEDPRVLDLATRVEQAQQPEIDVLEGWLEEWGAEPAAEGGHDADHGAGHGGDTGMMSADDMAELEAAEGAEFDRRWLQMMTEHHLGAVDMARTEIADGRNEDAVAMAREIDRTQTGEIAEMEELLAELGG